MTVQLDDRGNIILSDPSAASDADDLIRHLLGNRSAVVDWRACSSAHCAVLQVLLVARPELHGPPTGSFLRDYVEPLLT
jgi:hypothetical protein